MPLHCCVPRHANCKRVCPFHVWRHDKLVSRAARSRLLERGVEVGEIRHKTPIGAWDGGFAPGLDPARGDYASFANFSDPDGNSWVLQERGYRNE